MAVATWIFILALTYQLQLIAAQVTKITYQETCESIRLNNLYQKFELTLPLKVEVDGEAGTLTDLLVKVEETLASKDSKLGAVAHLTQSGKAQLTFLCDSFLRCKQLEDELRSNPAGLQRALHFVPVGSSGNLGPVRSTNPPVFNCPVLRWVVFQRRVDGSLSFAQNWDAYVKGFGHPSSNYWMGLEQLFARTVTSVHTESARCLMRIETEDLNGNTYWGEYKRFEVLGPEQNYRLRVGREVAGSKMEQFVGHHNEVQFSTFDKHHTSCSQKSGFGGWWYNDCHRLNPNGAYTTDYEGSKNAGHLYCSIFHSGKFIPMRRTEMKYACF